jgi:hypothetical protein
MNRRNFFAFLPVAPAALMIEGARASTKNEQPRDGEVTLSLQGSTPVNRDPHSMYFGYAGNPDPCKRVSMAVGEDGNLWLKTAKGEWKKVVTE